MATTDPQKEAQKAAETGVDLAVMAAAGAVLLSWYHYFGRGDREMGLFVGLWPPTLLAFASYFKQTKISEALDKSIRQTGIRQRVENLM